jgi:hypothetical protein
MILQYLHLYKKMRNKNRLQNSLFLHCGRLMFNAAGFFNIIFLNEINTGR